MSRIMLLPGALAITLLVGSAAPAAGQMIDLETLAGPLAPAQSHALAISEAGDVVGHSTGLSGAQQVFLYRKGGTEMIPLTLGGTWSNFSAMNQAGDVIGTSDTVDDASQNAFVYRNGAMHEMKFDGTWSEATAINEAGEVCGVAQLDWADLEPERWHAFRYSNPDFGVPVMTDLGTLGGGTRSTATAINERGDVAGYAEGTVYSLHPFLYDSTVGMIDLRPVVGIGQALAINDAGDVAGRTGSGHVFFYRNGDYRELSFGGSSGGRFVAMNEAGDVIGNSSTEGNLGRLGFIYRNNDMIPLTFGGTWSEATAINEAGDVIGNYRPTAFTGNRAFLYDRNGVMHDLTLPGGSNSHSRAINEAGVVVGSSEYGVTTQQHAFVYRNGEPTDLGTLGGYSSAVAINEAGEVTGISETPEGHTHTFVYRNNQMFDLGTLGGTSSFPIAINEAGDITGSSRMEGNTEVHAFLVPASYTPDGSDVVVRPDPEVTLTFDEVITAGETTVIITTTGDPPPTGFKLGNPPTYYEITTTAGYNPPVEVCFDYSGVSYGNESTLKLYHDDGSGWIDVTTSLGTVNDTICGTVSSLSPFIIVELDNQPPSGPVVLWSPDHELVDVSSAISVSNPNGNPLALTFRVFSDESEIPETGDGTGRHAPDFKTELTSGAHGVFVRSERRGREDGRFYIAVITANDGNGGVTTEVCTLAVVPHDQNDPASLDDVLAQAAAAEAAVQAAVDSNTLPPPGLVEHGLSGELGPHQ